MVDIYDTDPKDTEEQDATSKRQYIHVLFDCCNIYQRIYRRRGQRAYIGWCPKCGRRVKVRVGVDGTQCRFFRAE